MEIFLIKEILSPFPPSKEGGGGSIKDGGINSGRTVFKYETTRPPNYNKPP